MRSAEKNLRNIIVQMFVVDNYAAFREKMYRSEDLLVQLISAARSCGIYFVVTGNSKGAIYYKVTEHISERVVLNMNDSGSYRDILNVPVPIVPEQAKGRAVALINKKAVEVQFAVPFDVDNESVRTATIQKVYEEMASEANRVAYSFDSSVFSNTSASPIPVATVYETKMEVLDSINDTPSSLIIGHDLTTDEAKGFDLLSTNRIFVGTRGNEAAIASIINPYAQKAEKRICLITSGETEKFDYNIEIIDDIDAFVQELFQENEKALDETIIVIDGFSDFYDRISDEALSIFEKALSSNSKINVVTFDTMQRLSDYSSTGLYVHLVRTNTGAIIGGKIDDSVAAAIETSIYEVPRKFREKELSSEQAIIYSSDKIAYINIERS